MSGQVVLFKAPEGGKVDGDAPAFFAARSMVDVAALAASSDDRIEAAEVDAINAEIRGVPELSKIERARLIAYANTLLKDTSGHRYAAQKLKALDADAKQAIVKSASAAILADGHASPAEVKFLERLFKSMGLAEDGAYSMLHRGAVVMDEPVAVAQEQRAPGVAIPYPAPAEAASSAVQIDHSRLERLRSETSAVADLLAGIFVEEDVAPSQPIAVAPRASTSRFAGLDDAHSALLEKVLSSGSLERGDFEEQARALRLLPDGAIEKINDWGFDRFNEPIIEDDDPVTVPDHVLTELMEAEAAE